MPCNTLQITEYLLNRLLPCTQWPLKRSLIFCQPLIQIPKQVRQRHLCQVYAVLTSCLLISLWMYEVMSWILLGELFWKNRFLFMKGSQTLSLQLLHQCAWCFPAEIPGGRKERYEIGHISCACPYHAQGPKPQSLRLINEI